MAELEESFEFCDFFGDPVEDISEPNEGWDKFDSSEELLNEAV